jgi:hypothetical protein
MAQIIETGGHGNCLFTSLSEGLDVNPRFLRQMITDYAARHPDDELMQETVNFWVKASEHRCIHSYVREMSRDGVDGTALEIALASKIFNRRIVVWNKKDKDYRVFAEYPGSKPTIHLLYTSEHYQRLSFD